MNGQSPHKWWFTLNSTVFSSNSDSSLPPLIGGRGAGLEHVSVENVDLLHVCNENLLLLWTHSKVLKILVTLNHK